MPRKLTLLLGAALVLTIASEGALAQTRGGGTIGYSAAERRTVDARLANLTGQLERFSSQRVMSPRLVRAIATEVGLANPRFSDSELLGAVEAMSERAVELRADNERMRTEIGRLSDPALRDPALALLAQAETTLDEGRLADAEALFSQLRELRWDESRAANEAWEAAVNAEALTAELLHDFGHAEDIRLEASRHRLDAMETSRQQSFYLANDAALGRYREGLIYGHASALERATTIFNENVLYNISQIDDAELWSLAQFNLATVLHLRADRSEDDASIALYDQAKDAYYSAIEFIDPNERPDIWANNFNGLGLLLLSMGPRLGNHEQIEVLQLASETFETLLNFYSRTDSPADWAMVSNNLGIALKMQGEFLGGEVELEYLEFAIDAYEAALEVQTRAGMPAEWVSTQNNLAIALGRLGELNHGEAGLEMLARSVRTYEAVLEVETRTEMPTGWASTQLNMGNALMAQGNRDEGAVALTLLNRAVDAYQAALEVHTRSEMPAQWAMTQKNMGLALGSIGGRLTGAERIRYWRAAEQAFIQALEVYNAELMQSNFDECSRALVRLRILLAEEVDG